MSAPARCAVSSGACRSASRALGQKRPIPSPSAHSSSRRRPARRRIPHAPTQPQSTATRSAQPIASGSLAGALRVSSEAGSSGEALATDAKSAWVEGFQLSLMVAAVVVAGAGLVAWKFLPDQVADLPLAAGLSEDELATNAPSVPPSTPHTAHTPSPTPDTAGV